MVRRSKAATVDLKLRLKEPLRAAIETAARENGVSMNSEMVRHLERSIDRDDARGGQRVAAIVEAMATAMRSTGEHGAFAATGKLHKHGLWFEHPYAFDQAVKAAMAVLENFRPPGEIVLPTPNVVEVVGGDKDIAKANKNLQEIYKQLGDLMAVKTLRDLEIKK